QRTRPSLGDLRSVRLRVVDRDARLGPSLHLARAPDHRHLERRRMKRIVAIMLVLAALGWLHAGARAQAAPQQAVIETTAGTFVLDLTPETAPQFAAHFLTLASEGAYDGTIFHRVVRHGMVQGGDPLSTDPSKRALYGTGGLNTVKADARAAKMTRGSAAAVLIPGKPDSAGAQFFVVLADQPALDGQYSVFGRVSDGLDVLHKI